jgi:PAS domain S-box-containing protein
MKTDGQPDRIALERLIEMAPHALAVTEGGALRFLAVNPAFCRLTGLPDRDLLGRRYDEIFREPEDHAAIELLHRVFRTRRPEEDRELCRARAGAVSAVWSYTVWPMTADATGDGPLLIEIRDRTAAVASRRGLEEMADRVRQVNERLLGSALREQEAAERAAAADRAKSDFLAMMSHGLRTPLTGIVGYTDLLDAEIVGPVNQRQRQSLQRIRECSAHLLELIDDVLSFAKAESQAPDVQPERVDVAGIARAAAAVIEPVIARKGIRLEVRTPDSPLVVETDPRKLRQILLNLLSNAAKFTDRGEIRLDVREESTESICLLVADTGIGIQSRDIERVFEPFVQAEAVLTRRNGGTGLGLAISRALSILLGGDLVVESTPGVGSTFLLHLPRSVTTRPVTTRP